MPPPATKTKPLVPYSANVRGVAIVSYYNDTVIDYAEVKIHVNGVVPKGSCKFAVAADCMSILWQRATDKIFLQASTSRPLHCLQRHCPEDDRH